MKDTGKVDFHGKEYKTVALRVNEFREAHPDWAITTDLVDTIGPIIIMKAYIKDDTGRIISTGFAEEDRTKGQVNKTSALENCETSAVGRALAFFGLAGSEICSADELANAINQQNNRPAKTVETKMASVDQKTRLLQLAGMLKEIEPENSAKMAHGASIWTEAEAYSWISGVEKAHPEFKL